MLAIAGGKGGCGKTTTTLGLALAAARAGRSALAVDADVDMPDLHHRADVDRTPALGDGDGDPAAIAQPVPGRPAAAVLPAPVGRALTTAADGGRAGDGDGNRARSGDGDRAWGGGGNHSGGVDGGRAGSADGDYSNGSRGVRRPSRGHFDALDAALARCRGAAGVVLVDCPAGAGPDAAAPLRAADRTVLVTTLEPACLRDTAKTAAMSRAVGTPVAGTVVSRAEGASRGVETLLEAPTLGAMPAVDEAEPVDATRKSADAIFRELAGRRA